MANKTILIASRNADGTAHTATYGTRVELSPGCDLWMQGARFGAIRDIISTDQGIVVAVKLDKVSRWKLFKPSDLMPV